MDIIQVLRLHGHSDVLNKLVDDKKRLTLEERESIEAIQTAAMRAAQEIEKLRATLQPRECK